MWRCDGRAGAAPLSRRRHRLRLAAAVAATSGGVAVLEAVRVAPAQVGAAVVIVAGLCDTARGLVGGAVDDD